MSRNSLQLWRNERHIVVLYRFPRRKRQKPNETRLSPCLDIQTVGLVLRGVWLIGCRVEHVQRKDRRNLDTNALLRYEEPELNRIRVS